LDNNSPTGAKNRIKKNASPSASSTSQRLKDKDLHSNANKQKQSWKEAEKYPSKLKVIKENISDRKKDYQDNNSSRNKLDGFANPGYLHEVVQILLNIIFSIVILV
jgi:hypothetical protein